MNKNRLNFEECDCGHITFKHAYLRGPNGQQICPVPAFSDALAEEIMAKFGAEWTQQERADLEADLDEITFDDDLPEGIAGKSLEELWAMAVNTRYDRVAILITIG